MAEELSQDDVNQLVAPLIAAQRQSLRDNLLTLVLGIRGQRIVSSYAVPDLAALRPYSAAIGEYVGGMAYLATQIRWDRVVVITGAPAEPGVDEGPDAIILDVDGAAATHDVWGVGAGGRSASEVWIPDLHATFFLQDIGDMLLEAVKSLDHQEPREPPPSILSRHHVRLSALRRQHSAEVLRASLLGWERAPLWAAAELASHPGAAVETTDDAGLNEAPAVRDAYEFIKGQAPLPDGMMPILNAAGEPASVREVEDAFADTVSYCMIGAELLFTGIASEASPGPWRYRALGRFNEGDDGALVAIINDNDLEALNLFDTSLIDAFIGYVAKYYGCHVMLELNAVPASDDLVAFAAHAFSASGQSLAMHGFANIAMEQTWVRQPLCTSTPNKGDVSPQSQAYFASEIPDEQQGVFEDWRERFVVLADTAAPPDHPLLHRSPLH